MYFSIFNIPTILLTEIAYGTLSGGSTMTFFRDSKIDVYKKVYILKRDKTSKIQLGFFIL